MKEFPLLPAEDRIAVLPDEPEDRVGSIYLPDTAKRVPCRGRIVAVGEGKLVGDSIIAPRIEVGAVVWYEKYQGQSLAIKDEKTGKETDYKFLRESDIIAIEKE